MEQSKSPLSVGELNNMKLPELRELASSRKLRGTSRMRKTELIAALTGAPNDSSAAAAPKKDAPKKDAPKADKAPADKAEPNTTQADKSRPKKSTSEAAASDDKTLDVRSAVAADRDATKDRQGRSGRDKRDNASGESADANTETSASSGDKTARLGQIELPEDRELSRNRNRRDRNSRRRGRDRNDRGGNGGNSQNRRDQRDGEDSPSKGNAPAAEETLVPIAGILDVQPNHAFVRTSGYLPGENDVYVTLGNVRRWGLRAGDAVVGAVRPTREDNNNRRQQKYNALVRVDSVNGMTIEQAKERREFAKLTPEYPNSQLRLETTPKAVTPRVIDLMAPIGKGQRGMIVAPPKAGKTMMIQQIAKALEVNHPEVHLMVVLVDERPEEVTDMRSIVKGEVVASTFDRPAHDHTTVAELAIERAKRLVEMGQDVVVLLDSLTRLSRAYNLAAPASGRILSGGVDAGALYPPKKFFGAARNLREGGSLTIIASALVETGSKMDEVIFEEFKGTGNMELRLSRQLADRRIFPAIDINASGTRREELLFSPEELRIMWRLRRVLGNLDQQSSLELVLGKLKETQNNAEFLMLVQKTTPNE